LGDVLRGHAPNVAAWVAELGAEAVCITTKGGDPIVAVELAARGVAFVSAEKIGAACRSCDFLHISGYTVVEDSAIALAAARLARDAGARVSVDVADWTELRRFGPLRYRELLDELAPDVLFATEAEWELLGGAYLSAPTGVLKRGPRGCTVFTAESKLDFAAPAVETVDPAGAGDAHAAGFLLGGSLKEAARRGIEAAARCSAKVGSLP
jgi:ribokinase